MTGPAGFWRKAVSTSIPTDDPVSEDALLDGQVRLLQPKTGFRVAVDSVLLAAALNPPPEGSVLDLGAGVGAVGLCLLSRRPDVRVTALERQPDLAELARTNAGLNGCGHQFNLIEGDARDARLLSDGVLFDLVASNPPYLPPDRADAPPDAGRALAHVESLDLADWITVMLGCLKPKGRLVLIQRADRLDNIITALEGQAGEIVVHPLWPKQNRAAKRVLVSARKGAATPLKMSPGTVLHCEDGSYTDAADALLKGAPLSW